MTQQDYSNDLVFRSNGEEYARIDGNGPWKQDPPAFALEVESTEIPVNSLTWGLRRLLLPSVSTPKTPEKSPSSPKKAFTTKVSLLMMLVRCIG